MKEIITMKRKINIIILLTLSFMLFTSNVNARVVKDATFVKCIDGDTATLNVDGENETVRLIAIDTLELSSENEDELNYATLASDFTCNKLKNASEIVLEFEDSAQVDKYNRLLAWVWVDKILLQKELILNGYAKVAYVYDKYQYVDSLCITQKNIQDYKTGIWSISTVNDTYCKNQNLLGVTDIIEYSDLKKETLTDTEKKLANILNKVDNKAEEVSINDEIIKNILYVVIFGSALLYVIFKFVNR